MTQRRALAMLLILPGVILHMAAIIIGLPVLWRANDRMVTWLNESWHA